MRYLLLTLTLAAISGCGYTVGAPYRPDVRTVHVPMVTSQSFRRGLEFQLTEAVQREIQLTTPYRLAKESEADTRLSVSIVQVTKGVLGETAFDDARELQFALAVQVKWEDLRTGRLLAERNVALPAAEFKHIMSTGDFAPEVGQSLATGTQTAMSRTARQIVQMMEHPW